MITERKGFRRWDEGNVNLSYSFELVNNDFLKLYAGYDMGIALGGNLGGLSIQNAFHHLIDSRTIENGKLQHIYDGKNTFGLVFGGLLATNFTLHKYISFDSKLNLQMAFGTTGMNQVLFYNGLSFNYSFSNDFLDPSLTIGLSENLYNSVDINLTIPGGYVLNKFTTSPQVGFALSGKSFSFGWQQRFNEGGSNHSIGMLFVQMKNVL